MENPLAGDLMIGVKAIAEWLGIAPRKVFYMAETGQLPGLFKIGSKWAGRKSTIQRRITELETQSGRAA
jgi:hypothetical protein